MSVASLFVRTAFGRGDAKRDRGLAVPGDIAAYSDLYYGQDADAAAAQDREERRWNLLDVYCPKDRTGRLPVIISVHGGGWVYGTKEVYRYYGMSLARKGFAFVNFNYRLAPEHKFPAQLEDVNHAVGWVLSHAEEYGLDAGHVFMVGDSAGAHLLTLYCAMCVNPAYSEKYDFCVPDGFVPKAVALNCGAYGIKSLLGTNGGQMKMLMKDLLGKCDFEQNLEKVDAISCVSENFPPAYIMSATGDFLRDQAGVMRDKLAALGVPHRCRIYGTQEKKLPHVFHCDMKLEQAHVCNEEECRFFREYLRQ